MDKVSIHLLGKHTLMSNPSSPLRSHNTPNTVSVFVRTSSKLPVCRLRHRLSSRQLFMACGGIPGSSSRHSLSPAYFMGTGGRASQMVFLRNYYVLIHCEGACSSLPLFPSYWEVTVRLTERRECMRNRGEGGRLMGDVKGTGGI